MAELPTTLFGWADHCHRLATKSDDGSLRGYNRAQDWRALADLAHAAREPQTAGVDDGPLVAAVARLASRLEES